jgi:hypothetical protein
VDGSSVAVSGKIINSTYESLKSFSNYSVSSGTYPKINFFLLMFVMIGSTWELNKVCGQLPQGIRNALLMEHFK